MCRLLEADLHRDEHPSYSRVEPQHGVPVSLIGPWRDDEHPEFVIVWVALAGFFAAGFVTALVVRWLT